jgi:hypothetical protein
MAYLYENVCFFSKNRSVVSQKMANHLKGNNVVHAVYENGDTPVTNVRPCITFVKNEYDGDSIGGMGLFVSTIADLPADFTEKAETQVQLDARNAV